MIMKPVLCHRFLPIAPVMATLLLAVPAHSAELVLNEFMASNGTTLADEDGDFEDWIELFNPGSEPVNLDGWGLSDDPDEPFRWVFPAIIVQPGGHQLVWASGKDRTGFDDPAPPAAPVVPDELPGLVAWFRADALVAADGDPIETWTDASGSGNDAVQAVSGDRPLMREAAINGLPALEFGGPRQFTLPRATFSGMDNLENFTFVAVARWDGGVTSGLWGTGPSNATSGNLHFEINSGGSLRLRVGGMSFQSPGAVATGWRTLAATQDSTFEDPFSRIYVDGTLVGVRSEDVGNTSLAEYGGFFLGNSHNSQRNFDGLIAEVVIFNRALDPTELASLHKHLEEKYEIGGTLQPPDNVPHTNFRISSDGEPLVLTRPDGTTADFIAPVAVPRDTSFGRQPDGSPDFHHFLESTPDAPNTTQAYTAPVPPPDFSVPRGFHSDAFDLTLTHPDPEVEIYFTLDGDAPIPGSSQLHAAPIPVNSTTVVRAYAHKVGALPTSKVETHSYLFLSDILLQRDDPAALGFPDAWGTWTATHYGFEPEISEDPAYAPLMEQALTSFPTISLVMEMDDLFDPDTGIYASRSRPGGAPRGEAWERPASVEILYPDGRREDFQINAGIRAQGGASRRADRTPKGSFRLLFKNIYETGSMRHALLGDDGDAATEFNTIILRAEYNNEWLHGFDAGQRRRGQYVRDQFIRHTQVAMSGTGSRSTHAHLYLNGVYWGLYNPSERPDAAFGASYFGGEREDWDAVSHRGIRDGNGVAWNTLNTRASADLSITENYHAVLEYIDLPQYIDYMIVNLWSGMQDWPFNNWNAIRRREDGNGFMFFCWDSERSMEGLNENRTGVSADSARFYDRMRANPEFRLAFADRVHRHFFNDGALTVDQNIARYQAAAALVETAVIAESARWGSFRRDKGTVSGSESEAFTKNIHWDAEYNRLVNDYLPQRTAIALQQFRNANLYPSIDAPSFHQHGGELAPGELLEISAPQGRITYTLDGTDPRDAGGLLYSEPITITGPTVVRARVLHSRQWSALLEAEFTSADALPERIDLVEQGAAVTRNPTYWFDPPLSGSEILAASTAAETVATATIDGGEVFIAGLLRGETVLTLTADDGENDPVEATVRLLVHPAPHVLAGGAYAFDEWDVGTPAGVFPPHMLFLQGTENDSLLTTKLDRAYHIPPDDASDPVDVGFPYAATARTRINGLGDEGVAFINTGRGRDLGGALLALDTTGLSEARLGFTAGTVLPNSRIYAIRLQYRLGTDGPFSDVIHDGEAVEYVRDDNTGHEQRFGPIDLPGELLDGPYVQLLWRYHRVSGTSGPRAQLRLDDVLATAETETTPVEIVFDTAPISTQSGEAIQPVVVRLLDAAGFPATGFNGPVTLSLLGDGLLTGTLTVDAINGTATFDDLLLTGTGTFQLQANAAGLDPVATGPFQSVALTELVMPRFIQGGLDLDENNIERVPYAFRLRFEGLLPNAVYRYGNRVALATDAPDNDGAGNGIYITGSTADWVRNTNAPRFRDEDLGSRHWTFTTDADGAYTGWFVAEPTGNARFATGNDLHMRLLLNDGAGGEATTHILTTTQSAAVLPFGSGVAEGTGIIGQTTSAARRMVVLYDETDGTSRPLAATPVEITGSEVDDRYVTFYETVVSTNPQHWGTIIPNDLSGGLRRIEVRALTGDATLDLHVDGDGIAGTHNPDSGTTPVLLDAEVGVPRFLPGGDGSWNDAVNWSNQSVPDGSGQNAILNAPVGGDRAVTIHAPVTIGNLRVEQDASAHRNRIDSADELAGLDFANAGQTVVLRVLGNGAGFVEFNLDAPVTLADTLQVIVDHRGNESDDAFGGLRLRGPWQGSGGITKQGLGVASITGGGKDFTGALLIEQGALRVTEPAVPGGVSSVTVLEGGQLRLISSSSPGEPRVHTFGGGAISLAGMGRGGELASGEELGVLGALRYDPSNNDNHAILMNPVELAADTDIHVDGTRNLLEIQGTIGGVGTLIKTGGGTLRLAADSATFAGPFEVRNGSLEVNADFSAAAVHLGDDGVLAGSGAVGPVSGTGSVEPGAARLTAPQSGAPRYRFVFSNNRIGTLELTSTPALSATPQQIDIHLDVETLSPGEAFRGGLLVDAGYDLAAALESTTVNLFVAEEDGGVDYLGREYRPAEAGDNLTWAVAETPEGRLIEVVVATNFQLWRETEFTTAELQDAAISGPSADPSGMGVANLMRYALGLGRNDPPAPRLPRLADAGSFHVPINAAKNDIIYRVQASPDLADWSTVLFDSHADPAPATDDDGWATVAVPGGAPRIFVRLEVLLAE